MVRLKYIEQLIIFDTRLILMMNYNKQIVHNNIVSTIFEYFIILQIHIFYRLILK